MKARKVKTLLPGDFVDMGGLKVRQPFPNRAVAQIDPFLLLHHHAGAVPQYRDIRHVGVGPHPHRGFSPVTFIFKGGVHHRDSRGNNQVVYEGVQWMHAGRGIIHSERPPADIHERGGVQEIIQVWVNSPAVHKMDEPAYFPLAEHEMKEWRDAEGKVTIRIASGELFGITGPIPALSPLNAATLEVKEDGKIFIPLPQDHHAFIYLLDGKLNVDGFGLVDGKHAVVFESGGEGIGFTAREDTRVLLMSGAPLNEPVVSHGPFVMNTHTEILEAMRDYQQGKMGILIED